MVNKIMELMQVNTSGINRTALINTSVDSITPDDQISENSFHGISQMPRTYSNWDPETHGATLVWRDLNVYAKLRLSNSFKKIVNNVSGAVKPGSFVALMGSSGAGKTTLMGTLAYRNPDGVISDGEILLNARPLGPYMHRLSGFMHQEDLFIGCLTVEEHLTLMARLKMDRRTTSSTRNRRINELITQMGLQGSRHTKIGLQGDEKLLSGGEKKRLAFATELINNPMLLFCDEPTTGLDSYSAQKLVGMMQQMTEMGRTIICTIHQPSSEVFAMFNQIILVADGRIAYSGTSEKALEFFESHGYECPRNYNTADFLIKTLAITPGAEDASKATIRQLCDQFAVSEAAKEINVSIQFEFHMYNSAETNYSPKRNDFKEAFWWVKLFWLSYRCFIQVLRDKSVQAIRIFQKILIAIMAGLCFVGTTSFTQSGIQSVQGALFILISENTFSPMYSTLAMFPEEFPLFMREYRSGLYTTSLYYLSKLIGLFPGLVVEPVIFVIIAYWLAGLRATFYAFFMTLAIATMVMNCATACGCMFSCAFDSVPVAMAYLIPFDYTLMITSGLFVRLSSLPSYISWVRYMSWLMYSNEAMTIIQWDGISNITCENPNPEIPCLHSGKDVLDTYSFSDTNLWNDIIAMVVLYSVFHIIAFIFLKHRAKKRC